jgi:hypothetical protein
MWQAILAWPAAVFSTWQAIFTWAAALSSIIAVALWITSTMVREPAPKETAGVGALLGGYLIVRDGRGRRLDLPGTLQRQSLLE